MGFEVWRDRDASYPNDRYAVDCWRHQRDRGGRQVRGEAATEKHAARGGRRAAFGGGMRPAPVRVSRARFATRGVGSPFVGQANAWHGKLDGEDAYAQRRNEASQ